MTNDPQESCHFTRNRCNDNPGLLAGGHHRAVTGAESDLRFPERRRTRCERGNGRFRRRAMGPEILRDRAKLAAGMAGSHSLFAFPAEVRKIIYTTNSSEALNSEFRRAVRARGHFPDEEAATKLLYLILNRSEKEWKMPPREWTLAKPQFAVLFGECFMKALVA